MSQLMWTLMRQAAYASLAGDARCDSWSRTSPLQHAQLTWLARCLPLAEAHLLYNGPLTPSFDVAAAQCFGRRALKHYFSGHTKDPCRERPITHVAQYSAVWRGDFIRWNVDGQSSAQAMNATREWVYGNRLRKTVKVLGPTSWRCLLLPCSVAGRSSVSPSFSNPPGAPH